MQFAEISNSEKLFFKTFVDYDNPSLIHKSFYVRMFKNWTFCGLFLVSLYNEAKKFVDM